MANMIPISTITVGSGGATSVVFSNIPQTYTDLCVKISARGTASQTGIGIFALFNSGPTTNYQMQRFYGTGALVGTSPLLYASSNYSQVGEAPAATSTSNVFSNAEFYVPNYSTVNRKSVAVDAIQENNASTALLLLNAGIYIGTEPITSIKFQCGSSVTGDFAQYSTFTLYGIRKY